VIEFIVAVYLDSVQEMNPRAGTSYIYLSYVIFIENLYAIYARCQIYLLCRCYVKKQIIFVNFHTSRISADVFRFIDSFSIYLFVPRINMGIRCLEKYILGNVLFRQNICN
jgi:hypothetical protein